MFEKEIPKKNYVKLIIIVLVTLALSVTIFIIYNNKKDYDNSQPILRNKVKEIDYNDIDNYIDENETVLLYFGSVKDENSKKVEKDILKLLDKREIDLIYVNITDVDKYKSFCKSFNEKYNSVLYNYPAFIYIKNKEVVDLVQKSRSNLEIYDITNILDKNEINGEKND